MRRLSIPARAALAPLLAATLTLAACSSAEPMPSTAQDYAQQLFQGVNAQREDAGLGDLAWSECLATKALPRARAASTEDTLNHEPLAATCNPNAAAGENLSRGSFTPAQIVAKWMESEGHRDNILRPGFTDAGIGCVPMPDGTAGFTCSLVFEGGE